MSQIQGQKKSTTSHQPQQVQHAPEECFRFTYSRETLITNPSFCCDIVQLGGIDRRLLIINDSQERAGQTYDITTVDESLLTRTISGVASYTNSTFDELKSEIDRSVPEAQAIQIPQDTGNDFSSRSSTWLGRIISLGQKVKQLDQATDAVSLKYIRQIELTSPGDIFGVDKLNHMRELTRKAPKLALQLGLSLEDSLLFVAAVRVHDLGRFEETIQSLDTLSKGFRHGALTVEVLKEHKLLADFLEEQRALINDVSFYHSEKILPDNLPDINKRITLLLQSFDRRDIFVNSKFGQPEGVLEQLQKHYLDKESVLTKEEISSYRSNTQLKAYLLTAIDEALRMGKVMTTFPSLDPTSDKVLAIIIDKMTHPVNPRILEAIKNHQQADVSDIGDGYPSYMALQVAIIFGIAQSEHDLGGPLLLQEIQDDNLLEWRLAYLKSTIPEEQYQEIRACIERYLQEKLK